MGSARNHVCAPDSICPQDGVGGVTPTPRKDSEASVTMFEGSRIDAYVMTGAASDGSSSRRATRSLPEPPRRAAATKSSSLRLRVWARTIRDVPPQLSRPMIRISSSERGNSEGTTAVRAMPMTRNGSATITSVTRLRKVSRKRLPRPAARPTATPMASWTTVAPRATSRETRAPYSIRTNRSRPVPGSTPSQWSALTPPKEPVGTPPRAESIRLSWYVLASWPSSAASSGAASARTTSRTRTTAATTAEGRERSRRHTWRPPEAATGVAASDVRRSAAVT